jgi:hypothetical protein
MTLGEAFVKSPAYDDFVKQFKGPTGQIRNVALNIKSSFEVPGFDTKALVTGVSDTSGGAFVVNDRYGRSPT